MEVFVEGDFGRREWVARMSISAGIRGSPGRRYRPVGGGERINIEIHGEI